MATHFNLHGVPNGWTDRGFGAWMLPVLGALVWALLRPGSLLLGPAWRARMQLSPVGLATALLAGLLCALQCVILYAAIHHAPAVGAALGLVVGAFSVALGMVLPRIRRNPWLGVRTPWSLSSDENWAHTHRFAGFAFCIGGGLAILAALGGAPAASLVISIASAVVPVVYSFVHGRRA